MSDKKNLPTLQDLNLSPEEAFKKDSFNYLVNQKPPKKWIKKAPAFMGGQNYIPVDKVEFLLKKIIQTYCIEIREVKQIANSIEVTVRIHYNHPVTGEKMFQDGAGAAPIKVDKGHSASEMQHIKSSAVMTGLPAAKSFAKKNAAEEIGDIFGANINRKDTLAFKGSYASTEDIQREQELSRVKNFIQNCMTIDELETVPEEYMELEEFKNQYKKLKK